MMEPSHSLDSRGKSLEDLPKLLQMVSSEGGNMFDQQVSHPGSRCCTLEIPSDVEMGGSTMGNCGATEHSANQETFMKEASDAQRGDVSASAGLSHAISISLPNSPNKFQRDKKVNFEAPNEENTTETGTLKGHNHSPELLPEKNSQRKTRFYSQPILSGPAYSEAMANTGVSYGNLKAMANTGVSYGNLNKRNGPDKNDPRYAYFKTKSARLERQISRLRGKPTPELDPEVENRRADEAQHVPAGRFFDALEGPELEILKDSEELVLPNDKLWPFLLRFPISCFGISLGVASQAILWKNLSSSKSMHFLHVHDTVNLILWFIGLLTFITVFFVYSLKCIFYFEAVRREYYHPVRVNFFFAPWIGGMFLALGIPPNIVEDLHPAVWCVTMFPILCLELKIYGQWMSGGDRRLSKVANPSNHLAIVGNFVGALLGAAVGWKEGGIFFFSVGLAHYLVLFVTLYQRLPTNETLPHDLHPVFFLFVAAPSVASVAWEKISGEFDYVSKVAYFIALFLYASLAVRINFFRGFRFSVAWWAYTFPMTGAAIATIRYSLAVTNPFTQVLAVALSLIAAITVMCLFVTTILHAFVWGTLFPNDVSIAITTNKKKHKKAKKKSKVHAMLMKFTST